MSKVCRFQVVKPNGSKKGKPPEREGPSIADIRAKATEGLASLQDDFLDNAAANIAAIEKMLLLAHETPDNREEALEGAIRHAESIKVEAPSRGYHALGLASALLQRYLKRLRPGDEIRADVTEAHLGAMLLILNEGMTARDETAHLIDALQALAGRS